MMLTRRQDSLPLLVQTCWLSHKRNFSCREMKTNKQQSVLFSAFTVPQVLKSLTFVYFDSAKNKNFNFSGLPL